MSASCRNTIYSIVETSDNKTGLGRAYDIIMILVIVASIVPLAFKEETVVFEWIDRVAVTFFIFDYIARWITADKAFVKWGRKAFLAYPITPFAIIDLLSILPSITALNSGFRLLRILRLMRLFRVFKLFRYSKSISRVVNVFKKQKAPLLAVASLAFGYVVISALVIFNVEPESFNTFYDAIYWATISLTTVGYGDIYPITESGQAITMISSLFGIAIVALPAGIITAGYMDELNNEK